MATCNDIDNSLTALKASNDARFAAMQAQIDACCARTDNATNLANQALQAILAIQAVLANLGTQFANLVATVAVTLSLSNRVDALEAGQNLLSNDISRILTLITSVRSEFDKKLKDQFDFIWDRINQVFTRLQWDNLELLKLIQACCKRIDDFLDPNNPNSPMNNQCCNEIKAGLGLLGAALAAQTAAQAAAYAALQTSIAALALEVAAIGGVNGLLSLLSNIGTILGLLDRLMVLLDPDSGAATKRDLEKYFPNISGSLTGTLCNGTIVRASYSGQGLNGINSALKAQSYIDDRVLQDLLVCISNLINPRYNGAFVGTDCNNLPINIRYSNADLETALQALFIALQDHAVSLCKKLDPNSPTNNPSVSGSLGISACGVTDTYSYGVPRSREILTNIRGATLLIGKVLDAVCKKLDIPINGTVNKVICGETLNVNYGGVGLLGVVSAVNAQAQIQQRAIDVVCKEVQENMCTVLEPSDEDAERNLVTQMMIRFVAKGTTNFKGVSAWRMHIPNPRPGITCADLVPLTWTKGRWVGKILFANGNMNTWSYFNTEAEAERVLLHMASLSTDPLKQPEPRMTKNGSPKRNPVIVEVVPWYAVITTLSNGQVTDVKCLKCLL
jgi:hypothetical protein